MSAHLLDSPYAQELIVAENSDDRSLRYWLHVKTKVPSLGYFANAGRNVEGLVSHAQYFLPLRELLADSVLLVSQSGKIDETGYTYTTWKDGELVEITAQCNEYGLIVSRQDAYVEGTGRNLRTNWDYSYNTASNLPDVVLQSVFDVMSESKVPVGREELTIREFVNRPQPVSLEQFIREATQANPNLISMPRGARYNVQLNRILGPREDTRGALIAAGIPVDGNRAPGHRGSRTGTATMATSWIRFALGGVGAAMIVLGLLLGRKRRLP
jgi:hypothetical protein